LSLKFFCFGDGVLAYIKNDVLKKGFLFMTQALTTIEEYQEIIDFVQAGCDQVSLAAFLEKGLIEMKTADLERAIINEFGVSLGSIEISCVIKKLNTAGWRQTFDC
jgi:hypothetical protein